MAEPARSLEDFLDGALDVESFGISVVDGVAQPGIEIAGHLPGGASAVNLSTSLQVWAGGDGPEDWLLRLEVERAADPFFVVLGLREHRALLDDMARAGSLVVVPTAAREHALKLDLDGEVLGALLHAIDGE